MALALCKPRKDSRTAPPATPDPRDGPPKYRSIPVVTLVASKPSLACVVITKNEEANIQDCLRSAQWANELIVVDAESCDKTVELAHACGAKVSVRPWPGFGLQKNFGMAQASSDWILILDADERVTEELHREVRTCLEGWRHGAPVAYRIPRRTYLLKQGFRDGVNGLIVCVFASMYTFVKYAKLWDATRQVASHPDAS